MTTSVGVSPGPVTTVPAITIIGPQLTSEPYGLAISKQHPEFVRFVNAVLEQLRTDGQWKSIYTRWLGSPAKDPPPAKYAG
jgi:polar amino acid transport system substrate-binding protein